MVALLLFGFGSLSLVYFCPHPLSIQLLLLDIVFIFHNVLLHCNLLVLNILLGIEEMAADE
jgi:hypothetical protein